MAIPQELIQEMKELIKRGRENGKILPLSEAFRMYPVEEEVHKGRIEYWTDPEGWERGDYRGE